MKFKLLFALAVLVFGSYGLAGAESVTLDHVDGLIDATHVATGQNIVFYMRFASPTAGHKGITTGWRVYSPTANWDTTTIALTGTLLPAWFDLFLGIQPNPQTADGVGSDTVGIACASLFGPGMPAGFSNIVATVTIGPIDPAYNGQEICLDSSFYPPSGVWKWAGPDAIPTWDGPHCYTIGAAAQPPDIVCPTTPFNETICSGAELCLPLTINNAQTVTANNGATWVDGQLCFTPPSAGYYTIHVVATNGALTDECDVNVSVGFYPEPVITCPGAPIPVVLGAPGSVCVDLPIAGYTNVVVTGDPGTWSGGQLCFNATTARTYNFTVTASGVPQCGVTDVCDVAVNVSITPAPVISCPAGPIALAPCSDAGNLCVPLVIVNAENVTVSNGGDWSDNELCFSYSGSGQHNFHVVATNGDLSDECDVTVNVNVTPPVTIDCPAAPVDVVLPAAGQACISLPITNYNIVTTSGGTWSAGQFCFNAPAAGPYNFTVTATSTNPACPPATCNLTINVSIVEVLDIVCPDAAFNRTVCAGDEVCVPLTIVNAQNVTTSMGSWAAGQLCFTPATAGQYVIHVTATAGDQTDECDVTINVSFRGLPTITCPGNQVLTTCPGEMVCFAVPVSNADEVVPSMGSWVSGQFCFTPGGEGIFNPVITASNDCGSEQCTFQVQISYYAAPVACFTPVPSQGPIPLEVNFNNCSSGLNLTYYWDFDDGYTSTDVSPTHVFSALDYYDVTLTVTDDCGRQNSVTHQIWANNQEVVIPSDRWIVVGCESPMLDDAPLVPGDMIGARDLDGVLCGLAEVDEGGFVLTVYGNSPWTEIDEGPEPGEPVSFEINGVPVTSTPPVIWTENGDVFEVCEFASENCVDFNMPSAGWYLISWNLQYSGTIEDFVALMGGCVDVVLGFDQGGLTYDPSLPQFSTLGNVDYYHGYWVRVNCPVSFEVCGDRIVPDDFILTYAGWNLVSYWPDDVLPVEDALVSIMPHLQVAYGFDHGFYDYIPGEPPLYSQLENMGPGFGYWLRVDADGALMYPGFGVPPVSRLQHTHDLAKMSAVTPSRTWMSVYGANLSFDGVAVADKSTVEIYTSDGTLCGSGLYSGGLLKFTPVYGYDNASAETSAYPRTGDRLELRINGERVDAELAMGTDGTRIDLNTLAKGSNLTPGDFNLMQNYPNPFNPTTTIGFNLPNATEVHLVIFNVLGQHVITLVDGQMGAGQHEVVWNGNDANGNQVTSGVYFYRLKTADFDQTKKMVLMK